MALKKKIILYVLLLGGGNLNAQAILDSLQRRFDSEKSDSARLEIKLRLSKESEYYDYSLALKHAEEATEIANGIGKDWAKGKLYLRMAFLETMRGAYSEALRYDLESVKMYSANKDSANLSIALNDVGSDYRDMGQYEEGYFYLTQSYRVARMHGSHGDSLIWQSRFII